MINENTKREILKKIKTRRDAILFEKTFLGERLPGESASDTARRLHDTGEDDKATAYQVLVDRFPGLWEGV